MWHCLRKYAQTDIQPIDAFDTLWYELEIVADLLKCLCFVQPKKFSSLT